MSKEDPRKILELELFINEHLQDDEKLNYFLYGEKVSSASEQIIKAASGFLVLFSIFIVIFIGVRISSFVGVVITVIFSIAILWGALYFAGYLVEMATKKCFVGFTENRIIAFVCNTTNGNFPDYNGNYKTIFYELSKIEGVKFSGGLEPLCLAIIDRQQPLSMKFSTIRNLHNWKHRNEVEEFLFTRKKLVE